MADDENHVVVTYKDRDVTTPTIVVLFILMLGVLFFAGVGAMTVGGWL